MSGRSLRIPFVILFAFACPLMRAQSVTESTLYAFTGQSDGSTPNSLIQASDGNFYGTTLFGGNGLTSSPCDQGVGCGAIFRITPTGDFTTLYDFNGWGDGAYPSQLVQGWDGNFYGVTIFGGGGSCADGCGTVFRISSAGLITILYAFSGGGDGANPVNIIQGNDGNFYGVTNTGNPYYGNVFQLTPSGALTVLYGFSGDFPLGLVQGTDGNFYGATQFGGSSDNGAIFSVNSAGTFNRLYSFTGGTDGTENSLVGQNNSDGRSKFKGAIVIKQGGHIIHQCNPICPSPSVYANPLIVGSNGSFYGATPGFSGGVPIDATVFSVTSTGALTTLYTFGSPDFPPDALLIGSDENFYGSYGSTIFQFSPASVYSTYYDLSETDSLGPIGTIVQGADGKFYGPGSGGLGFGTLFTLTRSPTLAPPVKLTLSASSVAYGLPVTLTWSVANGFSGTLQQCYATVQGGFSGAGNWSGLQAGAVNGSAYAGSAVITPTRIGTYTYALTCGGVESGFATLRVVPARSTTTLKSSANPVQLNQALTYTATVTSQYGAPATGWVTFVQGTTEMGPVQLIGGQAAYSTTYAAAGKYSITAVYSSDVNDLSSKSSTLAETVNLDSTTLQLASSFNPSFVNQLVTFTAIVSNPYATPTGTVTFKSGGVTLGTETLSNGLATISNTFTARTTVAISASYSGSSQFKASSSSLSQAVQPALTFSNLHSFKNEPDGSNPGVGGIVFDSSGNLYGITEYGGAYGYGTVYKLTPGGAETILHSFNQNGSDGYYPSQTLLVDSSGNVYGSTGYGGAYGAGVVFKLSSSGAETILYSFQGGSDGLGGSAPMILDSSGNLYGTATSAGSNACGTVFQINPSGNKTVLYNFLGGTDGCYPVGSVVADSAGNLYGATFYGGDVNCGGGYGCGTVFEIPVEGAESVLYAFTGANGDGQSPYAGLIRDSAGNLYGTTEAGGIGNLGTIFKINPQNQESSLYAFLGIPDGEIPVAPLVRDSFGNLYGTTYDGGADGVGSVFELSAAGQEIILYSFTDGTDGAYPSSGLARSSAGNIFGTTGLGGTFGNGSVFKVTP
jgi:uncharacterized repeat protein (TIGR03803 family)